MQKSQVDLTSLTNESLAGLTTALTPKMSKYVPYQPTPKQMAFLLMDDVREVLYGGAAGGGKSVCQLMAALQYVDVPGYSAGLFRQTFADLSLPGALMDIAKQWLTPYVLQGEIAWSEKERRFTFPSSATIQFGYLDAQDDAQRYLGAEFQYIGIDECTHIHPNNYRYMFSRLRRNAYVNAPLRFRATSNPGGKFGEYYYNRFFVEQKPGRLFMFANIDDNPYLDAVAYKESLEELDPVTRAQLLNGDWSIREQGDMFDPSWLKVYAEDAVPAFAETVRFWDLAGSEQRKRKTGGMTDPDYTVGIKMGYKDGVYYLLDIVRMRGTPSAVAEVVQKTAKEDGYLTRIKIEQEPGSAGVNVIDYYAKKVLPGYTFTGVRTSGSKVERARPVSAALQNGNVVAVGHIRNIQALKDEMVSFPGGLHDDCIDALSGAFTHFRLAYHSGAAIPVSKTTGSKWRDTQCASWARSSTSSSRFRTKWSA